MGSCISKCSSNPSPHKDPPLPQDKPVISQSPANPPNNLPITKTPLFSSSSSSSSSSSLSLSSSKTSIHSYSSASSSLKDGSFSNEFLLSCARKNPKIVVLDPHERYSFVKPADTTKIPVQRFQSPAKVLPNPALPVKRARSNSPPAFDRQKSFRSRMSTTVLHPPANRVIASPTARRRCNGDVCVRQQHMHTNGVPPRNVAVALPLSATKEKLPYPSPCNPASSSREKDVPTLSQIHRVNTKDSLILNQRREVPFDQCHEVPEDIDNPLISMDCFIFL